MYLGSSDGYAICQLCAQLHIANTDIKLTNYILDSDGKIVIADKKAFFEIDDSGNLKDKMMTPLYAPPECRKHQGINAEACMVYQLGLAYYEYLILPEGETWSDSPLDFTYTFFSSEAGKQAQQLITQMTEPDPNKRPTLDEVQTQLNVIAPHVSSAQTSTFVEILENAQRKAMLFDPLEKLLKKYQNYLVKKYGAFANQNAVAQAKSIALSDLKEQLAKLRSGEDPAGFSAAIEKHSPILAKHQDPETSGIWDRFLKALERFFTQSKGEKLVDKIRKSRELNTIFENTVRKGSVKTEKTDRPSITKG